MTFRTDKDGHIIGPVWNRDQLKRRRMLIRAGIPIPLWSVEERILIDMCMAKNIEAWDEWYDWYCDSENFLKALRAFAKVLGVKHWRLRK